MDNPFTSRTLDLTSFLHHTNTSTASASAPIPRLAHFIHTTARPITWIEYLAIRGALLNLGFEKVVLWVASGAEGPMQGVMWKRVEAMERVVVVRGVVLPEVIVGGGGVEGGEGWGREAGRRRRGEDRGRREIPEGERAGLLRLMVLWEMGGIFLENDLVALKSSDDILLRNNASTIVAIRSSPEGIPNWMIMSKRGSTFLRRWLERYEGQLDPSANESVWNDERWKEMEFEVPTELAEEDSSDLTVLDGHSWYYPLASDTEGDVPLKKLWFGKSWESIGESYGTHIWHWDEEMRDLVTPETVRTIDTPLFCHVRRLFNNLDGGGYTGITPKRNANCSIVAAQSLISWHHRLFADYRMVDDDSDAKWVDSSGFHHHGWAPKGTVLRKITPRETYRHFNEHSFAVLPVPSGWDSREWTVRMDLQVDPTALDGRELSGLFKIRTEGDGDIVVRIGHQKDPGYVLEVEWREPGQVEEKEVRTDASHQSKAKIQSSLLKDLGKSWHSLAITCDRREKGTLDVYLNGSSLGSVQLQLQEEPTPGQEVWINAREWRQLDMGFRGSLRRFTIYADALTAASVHQRIPNNAASLLTLPPLNFHMQHTRLKESGDFGFLFLMVFTMAVALLLVRSKKSLVREGLRYARKALRGSC